MKQLYTLLVLFSMLTLSAHAQSDYSSDYGNDESAVSQANASSQNEAAVSATKTDTYRDHFTVGFKTGFNYFHLKTAQSSQDTATDGRHLGIASDMGPQFVFFAEYNFEQGLGVGAYLGNYCFNRAAVLGTSIEFGAYAHISLLECFSWDKPLPISRRFHMIWDGGLGVATHWQNNQIPGDASSDKVYWTAYAVVRTGLQFEFMVRPHWGLFIEGEYHGYGKPGNINDNIIKASPWIHAGAASGGIRYYFDKRQKEHDPRLDENDLPIHTPRIKKPKNAIYVTVTLTPEMLEEARRNNGTFTARATEAGSDAPASVHVSPYKQSNDINSALSTLAEQGAGTVLINSIDFNNNQLTDESMDVLDEVAGSLLSNKLWQNVELLYMSDKQAAEKASLIATYLRAKGVKNLSVKGVTAQSEGETSDLVISIK